MILNSSGTTIPGAPHRPEYLKALVYLPPAFVGHNPQLHSSILKLVQLFIESIAVKTTNDWTSRARSQLKWSLRQAGNPQPNAEVTGIPAPDPNSAQYTFLGQRSREPSEGTYSASITLLFFSNNAYSLVDVSNEAFENLRDSARDLENTNTVLLGELCEAHATIKRLEAQLEMSSGPSTRTPARCTNPVLGSISHPPVRYTQASPALSSTPSKP